MKRRINSLVLIGFVMSLSSCGGSTLDEGEDYGNLLETEEQLILTETEHPGGWGRAECTLCHNLTNIHLVDRTGINIDIATIHNRALAEGIAGCAACHGTNGVP